MPASPRPSLDRTRLTKVALTAVLALMISSCSSHGDPLAAGAPPPTLATVTPNNGVQGAAAAAVTIVGTHFLPGPVTVTVSGAGVTTRTVTILSDTSLTATFEIAANARFSCAGLIILS